MQTALTQNHGTLDFIGRNAFFKDFLRSDILDFWEDLRELGKIDASQRKETRQRTERGKEMRKIYIKRNRAKNGGKVGGLAGGGGIGRKVLIKRY
jgi:hypothetical protein